MPARQAKRSEDSDAADIVHCEQLRPEIRRVNKVMKFIRKRWMYVLPALLVMLAITFSMTSCTERQRKNLKHMKSDIIGLKRKITLYDCSGKVIRQWEGRFKVETIGGWISFIDDDGKDIKVSGTVVVEEL